MNQYIVGIDIGASATKAVLIDQQHQIRAQSVKRSGADLAAAAQSVYESVLKLVSLTPKQINQIITTGYGRHNVTFPSDTPTSVGGRTCTHSTITEISAHARGTYFHFPQAITVIDIGGQDNKVIKVSKTGAVLNFKMNRKCAAGTGAFLEEIAYKMDIPLEHLNQLAQQSSKEVVLGSYCTVFTATEILSKIRAGNKKESIMRGVFGSVIKRIIEMDPLEGDVVLTGGVVAYNNILVELLHQALQKEILVPSHPQFTGALGAALFELT